ncbi:glycosyltransferase family 4 protein [Lederbergia galactosidilytica]|uniref:Glycosyltransferase n=1 Tax=Lederbergia galactosidilytica TaxID=217031 RepID=A0A178A5Q3_9BACI|nr:glycosyltransferase family 4 protein [Lederbergia galactosidilytica]OAK74428.1 hypothetical protein ABB05_04200 [Lederbergia galactosidilytica]
MEKTSKAKGSNSILNLCSYYIGNKLYMNLFGELSKAIQFQYVYVPIRSISLNNKNMLTKSNVVIKYDNILKRYHRILYGSKIKSQVKKISNLVNIRSFDLIHAHTWFSDGGVAYLLKKKFGINYIVTIRNTDLNFFYKYAFHYRSFAHSILRQASKVTFLSPSYLERLCEVLPERISEEVKKKSIIIPNGIDRTWYEARKIDNPGNIGQKLNLVFIGSLTKNKNVETVINLLESLKSHSKIDVNLNIVGNGPLMDSLKELAAKKGLENHIVFHGQSKIEKLISIVDKSDILIVPSFTETFGIVYPECMSRGVPVIYTQNEGFDGFFENGQVGCAVPPADLLEIEKAVFYILENYDQISINCSQLAKQFTWENIGSKYIDLYTKIIEKNKDLKLTLSEDPSHEN